VKRDFAAHQPQKAQLSATANELMKCRPNDVKLSESVNHVDDNWVSLESALNGCERRAASELTAWMDGIEENLTSYSSLQPRSADDLEQLHNRFQV